MSSSPLSLTPDSPPDRAATELPAPLEPPEPPEAAGVLEPPEAAPPPSTEGGGQGTSFVGDARTVSILTFLSRLTGLLRDSSQGRAYGQAAVADAFAYAFQIPNLFRRLFGEGALTAAFLPVYTELLKKDPGLARRFASLCLVLLVVVLGVLTLGGEAVLYVLWRRSAASPDMELTWRLTMIMFPYMLLVCLVAVFGTILQVHGRFAPSAAQPILLNLVMTAAMVWSTWGVRGESALRQVVPLAAWSVLLAGVWQCVSQGALMLRYQKPTLDFRGAGEPLRVMGRTFVPMLLTLSVFQLNVVMDGSIALFLSPKAGAPPQLHLLGMTLDYPVPQGGVAGFMRSQYLYQFPLGVFAIPIATAAFAALAHAAAEGGAESRRRFRGILQQSLRLTVFVGLPASVGLLLVRLPLCRIIYEGKGYTLADAQLCAQILAGFAPAIWAYSMNHVLTRAFYAYKNSRTPMRVSLAMVALNLSLNLTLVWVLGVVGLAVSTAVCAMFQCVILLRYLRRYVEHPVDGSVWAGWRRTALLTGVMAAALGPVLWLADPAKLSRTGVAVELAVMVGLGAAVFALGARLLRMEELGWLLRRGRG